jgi:hypothetical protein
MFIRYIFKLRHRANEFQAYADAEADKFNKGYFEGKAEQCNLLADALEEKNPDIITLD